MEIWFVIGDEYARKGISADSLHQVPMDEIDIFDVSSYYNASVPAGTWYKQTTSGDTPNRRVDFCSVVASAPDGSSHNM